MCIVACALQQEIYGLLKTCVLLFYLEVLRDIKTCSSMQKNASAYTDCHGGKWLKKKETDNVLWLVLWLDLSKIENIL